MGKASRRKGDTRKTRDLIAQPPPFSARPFEGLASETEWVAMREIVPAATARVTATVEGEQRDVTIATILPMAWPAMHRDTGEVLVATQTGTSSGDASRDIASALVAAVTTEPGQPIPQVERATTDTPRLQEILGDAPLEVTVHEGFGFWTGDAELDPQTAASLERANDSVVPTVRVEGVTSAYWCRMGERTYVRWVLPENEDAATTALARLKARGEHTLGEGTTLLGAFRASGLLIPVFEVEPDADPQSFSAPLQQLRERLDTALQDTATPLTADERRARDGLVSRQLTLR